MADPAVPGVPDVPGVPGVPGLSGLPGVLGLPRLGDAAVAGVTGRLAELVEFESPSGDVARLAALRDVLAERLERLGGRVTVVPGPAGDHLRAAFSRQEGASPAGGLAGSGSTAGGHILVVGHYDTVLPAGWLAGHPFTVSGHRASGPGVFDMKGSIVALELALGLLADTGRGLAQRLEVVLVADEEVSSPDGRAVVQAAAEGAAAVVGLEPPHPDGALKNGRRGVARVRLDVEGRESHAGLTADSGVSAVDELVDQLVRLRKALPDAADLGCNVGTISGGTRANVVAGRASAEIGLRFALPETEQAALAALRGLAPVRGGARVAADVLSARPAWPASEGSALVDHVRALSAALGRPIGARPAGGAGDTNLTGAAGLPTVDGLGPRGRGAHSPDETVLLDSISQRAELLAALLVTPLPPLLQG